MCVKNVGVCKDLKGGVCHFSKMLSFRKLSWSQEPKQTFSQSEVRGMSTHDTEDRALSEQPS